MTTGPLVPLHQEEGIEEAIETETAKDIGHQVMTVEVGLMIVALEAGAEAEANEEIGHHIMEAYLAER